MSFLLLVFLDGFMTGILVDGRQIYVFPSSSDVSVVKSALLVLGELHGRLLFRDLLLPQAQVLAVGAALPPDGHVPDDHLFHEVGDHEIHDHDDADPEFEVRSHTVFLELEEVDGPVIRGNHNVDVEGEHQEEGNAEQFVGIERLAEGLAHTEGDNRAQVLET